MISELRIFQTYEHPRFPGGFRNSEVLLYMLQESNHLTHSLASLAHLSKTTTA